MRGLALAVDDAALHGLDLRSASNPAAITDDILPLPQIAERIAAHMQRHHGFGHPLPMGVRNGSESDKLSQVAAILRNTTGHDFHGYKRATFLRRVQRRMQVAQVETLEQYLEILRNRFDEPLQLFNDLLIGVTKFFRDRREFEFLEEQVIPRLFQGKHTGDSLRIWVLGCSTGEEAYSLAMLLREHAGPWTLRHASRSSPAISMGAHWPLRGWGAMPPASSVKLRPSGCGAGSSRKATPMW